MLLDSQKLFTKVGLESIKGCLKSKKFENHCLKGMFDLCPRSTEETAGLLDSDNQKPPSPLKIIVKAVPHYLVY